MPFLRILTPGGLVTPDQLRQIAALARQYALGKIEFGFRQDILINCTDNQLIELKNQIVMAGFQAEAEVPIHPNIVSSVVAQNIFPQLSWLRSGDYLDIIDAFEFQPRFKINLVDPSQELIRPLTAELNFIASPTPSFWYLVVNFGRMSSPHIWPHLLDSEQIANWVEAIEQSSDNLDFDALYRSVTARFGGRTRPITQELQLTPKPYPHHEGIYRYNDRYWIGLYQRDNQFEASFLDALSELCIETKIGRLYPTPFKTLIVKDIEKEFIFKWEKLLGQWGIHTHHSSLELNWQLPDADVAAWQLKTELVEAFEQIRIRTSSLSFSIGKRSSETTSTIVIEPLTAQYEAFTIVYSPDFYIGNTAWETFATDIPRKYLPEALRRLTMKYYEQLDTNKKTILSRKAAETKTPTTNKVMQCHCCLTVADIPLPLPATYLCPTCDATVENFVATELMMG